MKPILAIACALTLSLPAVAAVTATAVDLRVVGGSTRLGEDFFFPEPIRLEWAQGDTAPKTLYLTFDPAALALGDKTILLGLENADGLALDAADKTCAVTIRRHVPALGWPEEAGQPSEALAAWVTEAAARVVAEAGILADPYAPEAAFALRGGASLDEASWAETAPVAVGTPTRRSDSEVDIPLRFADPPVPNAFFRLLAR